MLTEQELRRALADQGEGAHGSPPTAAQMGSLRRSRRVRRYVVSASVAAVVALAVVLSLTVGGAHPPEKHFAASPRPSVIIQLELGSTTAPAGDPIAAQVIIINTTPDAITVPGCQEPWLLLGLTNEQVPLQDVGTLSQCSPNDLLPPGTTTKSMSISTRYQFFKVPPDCTPDLACSSTENAPPLPAGQYRTKIYPDGLPAGTQLPPAISITLT